MTACSGASASRTRRTDSSVQGTESSGSGTVSRSTSASLRTGAATTGPTFSTSSTATPIPRTGDMMSANMTAASTPWRRTGCRVTSAQSSGCAVTSKSEWRSRTARYSGSERPAWRMNHTGVRSTGSRRAARTRSGAVIAPQGSYRCGGARPVVAGAAHGAKALRERDFRLYFAGSSLSLLGDRLTPVALAFATLDLTGSAADLGWVLAAG